MPFTTIYYFHTPYILIRQVNYFLKLSRLPVPGPRLRGRYKRWSNVTIIDILPIPTGAKDPVVRSIALVIVQGDHARSCVRFIALVSVQGDHAP